LCYKIVQCEGRRGIDGGGKVSHNGWARPNGDLQESTLTTRKRALQMAATLKILPVVANKMVYLDNGVKYGDVKEAILKGGWKEIVEMHNRHEAEKAALWEKLKLTQYCKDKK
jgi:hypothetical protein